MPKLYERRKCNGTVVEINPEDGGRIYRCNVCGFQTCSYMENKPCSKTVEWTGYDWIPID